MNIFSENSSLDRTTAEFYSQYAQHGAIATEAPQSAISTYFDLAFNADAKVLDVGAGSGRDLAVLCKKGIDAYGIEPNDAMRSFALQSHPELAIRLQSGRLPLSSTPFGGQFDGIVCSAVMMHVPKEQLQASWESIRNVLKPNGRVLMSLPFMPPALLKNDRDKDGRFFQNHTPAFMTSLLKPLGFDRIALGSGAVTAHADLTWTILLFALRA